MKKYKIIYADPAWSYNDKLGNDINFGAVNNDKTASYIKKYVWERMQELQSIIDIENSASELEKFAQSITQQKPLTNN